MQWLSEAAFCDLSQEIILADMRDLSKLSALGLDLDPSLVVSVSHRPLQVSRTLYTGQ